LIRVALGVRIRDLDCAFKLFRREVVDRLRLSATGAAINAEMMVQCRRGGWKVREMPVSHYPRHHGAPTGAALRVIARAFRELPRLFKYRFTSVPGPAVLKAQATAPALPELPVTVPAPPCAVVPPLCPVPHLPGGALLRFEDPIALAAAEPTVNGYDHWKE
jgi:hypothetical protein